MKLIRKFLFLFLFFNFCLDSYAVQLPRIIGKEKRFRAYIYNPNDIYKYTGYYLKQSYIEFEKGEVIKSILMGDTQAWQTEIVGNKLFLKPSLDFAATNMTILSDKRTYHFELDALDSLDVPDDDVLFYIKFMYPEDGDKNIVMFGSSKKRSDLPDLRNLEKYNFDYEFSGSENIAPTKVFDDREFTYIEFKDNNGEIPAIFAVNSSGYETMVNYRIVENYIVIEQLNSQFTLRSGADIVCIYNNSLYNIKK